MVAAVQNAVGNCPRKTLDLKEDIEAPVARRLGAEWHNIGSYPAFAAAVSLLVEKNMLRPVQASGSNGRVPPLALRYRKMAPASSNVAVRDELLTSFRSKMNLAYFLSHPEAYDPVREVLRAIDRYLVETAARPPTVWDTVNERSFKLTGDEKYLASPPGRKLLKAVGITLTDLYCLPTPEPFFYWPTGLRPEETDAASCLVVENKDTFYSFKQLLTAGRLVTQPPVQLLIYGEGKKIIHSWPFVFECLTGDIKLRFFYFGDLDPEGVAICGDLMQAVAAEGGGRVEALPAEPLYLALLNSGLSRPASGDCSRVSPRRMERFFDCCSDELGNRIKRLWRQGRVVPQEALSASALSLIREVDLWPFRKAGN